ncbi:uncharacterized protein LOC103839506 [Brassica rapa]|uniref:uncharacterized protein LOC103839506 n=1 Tax=Brassica campestris TaxID=3711 RepID=UPI00142DE32A|nr:uncharacterized protein LOC103839506 [Brassica rapa]XP_033136845.1 uncharacterized protein LOC103839506 [Brassica rapa]
MSVVSFHEVPSLVDESDDEEAMERNAFRIEEVVAGFIDEAPIRHDIIPESDSDSDAEEEEGQTLSKKQRTRDRDRLRRSDGNLFEGQLFFNGVAFKEAVLDYALKTGYNLKQYRYDKTKLGYCCAGRNVDSVCGWRIYCSTRAESERWQIRVFKDKHSCVPNGECKMIKVPVIARLFVDKIREEMEYYMPKKMEEIIKERWKISVSRPQCQAARNKALRWIDKEYEQQFARLRDYAAEIMESNINSTVEVETVKNKEGQDVFDRFYVCLDVLRRTWKSTCRPIIGVDGCFLRGKTKGQLLVALGRDADNAIYPIAWGVVQVENTDNWLWFVKNIKADLALDDGDGFILISDRQKVSSLSCKCKCL